MKAIAFLLMFVWSDAPRPQIHIERLGNETWMGATLTASCPKGWEAKPSSIIIKSGDSEWFYHTVEFITNTQCVKMYSK